MKSYRDQSIEILGKFYSRTDTLKTILSKYFAVNKVDQLTKKRTTVLSKEIIRWKGRIDWYISKHLNSPFNKLQPRLLAALEIGTFEILLDDKVPIYASIDSIVESVKKSVNRKASGLVNAVLRKISRESIDTKPNEINDFDWYSIPNWLGRKWETQFGTDSAIQLAEYFLTEPQLMLRRNNCVIQDKDFVDLLPEDVTIKYFDHSDTFYIVEEGGSSLRNSELFSEGGFSFQDRASGMIVEVLDPKPGELILDVCCAPGTKTNYIAEYIQNDGEIYASDIDKNRIELAKSDSHRLKNTCIDYIVRDATKEEFAIADKILIDAPCTGTGTIGRRPDIKWRRKPKHLENIVYIQRSILENASKYLKSGGELVYATCSLEEEENWQVVQAFLKFHSDFSVVPIQHPNLAEYTDGKGALSTFPPIHKIDGMFAVKLKKNEK